ncbi:flagellar type III secretion system pore protein FliP [Oscillospiraceae bacterium MB08-C2-2]|nr:flagellar type III secretion system pore protein FliP [Oscillospiraceae bacterium MB08-C2-2]
MKKIKGKWLAALLVALLLICGLGISVLAAVGPTQPQAPTAPEVPEQVGEAEPGINVSINGKSSDSVKIILLMTLLTLLPSILIMMTCFTRIIIVFSLLRNALGLQQTPPNQVLIGLALFLTLFIMNPVISQVNETAFQPYNAGELTTQEFLDTAKGPLRDFMLKQTDTKDMNMFLNLAGRDRPGTVEEYGMDVVIPAFITSEIKRAFIIGFLLFIPFLVIDIVVSSALMSMGMVMLPPVSISLPFKLLLFITVDGWGLLIKALVSSYNP